MGYERAADRDEDQAQKHPQPCEDETEVVAGGGEDGVGGGDNQGETVGEKLRIVTESFGAPRAVSATARRYGLSGAQLFDWRRLAREGKSSVGAATAGFVPAFVLAAGQLRKLTRYFP
jgi:hypothetical protein